MPAETPSFPEAFQRVTEDVASDILTDLLPLENRRPRLWMRDEDVVLFTYSLTPSASNLPARQSSTVSFSAVSSDQNGTTITVGDGVTHFFLQCDLTAYAGAGNVVANLQGSMDGTNWWYIYTGGNQASVGSSNSWRNSAGTSIQTNPTAPHHGLPKYVRLLVEVPGTATVTGIAGVELS